MENHIKFVSGYGGWQVATSCLGYVCVCVCAGLCGGFISADSAGFVSGYGGWKAATSCSGSVCVCVCVCVCEWDCVRVVVEFLLIQLVIFQAMGAGRLQPLVQAVDDVELRFEGERTTCVCFGGFIVADSAGLVLADSAGFVSGGGGCVCEGGGGWVCEVGDGSVCVLREMCVCGFIVADSAGFVSGDGVMAAVQAKLARRQLPRLNRDGLVSSHT